MPSSAFTLEDRLIVYGDDKKAILVLRAFDTLKTAKDNCLLGVADFTDDTSIHADHWELHPSGDEIIFVIEGRLLASIEHGGTAQDTEIGQGQALIVPRQRWHRLRVVEPGRLLFFTPTAGLLLRPHITEGH